MTRHKKLSSASWCRLQRTSSTCFRFSISGTVVLCLLHIILGMLHETNTIVAESSVGHYQTSSLVGPILVTGGMGNIGKYVVRELLGLGHRVISLDVQDLSTELDNLLFQKGLNASLLQTSGHYRFLRADIRNSRAILETLYDDGAQPLVGIIHLAAVSRVAFCLDNQKDCRDVNVNGTKSLLATLVQHSRQMTQPIKKPWIIFASSREIYGSSCGVDTPCDETSVPQPINLYGETKWQGEQEIKSHSEAFSTRYMILRLSSVYGGLYDLRERLIPSLMVKSMTDMVIDLNGGDQLLDFVHLEDVVHSIVRSVQILQTYGGAQKDLEVEQDKEILICSGQSNTTMEILDFIRTMSRSKSPIRVAPSDNRFPSHFVCDNRKMIDVLGYPPKYCHIGSGLAAYFVTLIQENIQTLQEKYKNICANDYLPALDVPALEGCSLYIMGVSRNENARRDYLKHLSYPAPALEREMGNGVVLRRPTVGDLYSQEDVFLLEWEGMNTTDQESRLLLFQNRTVLFRAVFDRNSNGYFLKGTLGKETHFGLFMGKNFTVMEAVNNKTQDGTENALSVSIWPYSCPPREGKAHLPTEYYDAAFYLLHQCIPSESHTIEGSAPRQTLHCRHLEEALDYAKTKAYGPMHNTTTLLQNKNRGTIFGGGVTNDSNFFLVSSSSSSRSGDNVTFSQYRYHAALPLCDSDCDLIGECIQTAGCRCVEPLCGPDLRKPSQFPFQKLAYTDSSSYITEPVSDNSHHQGIKPQSLPYEPLLLRGPAVGFHKNWEPPKMHVVDLNFSQIIGKDLDSLATNFSEYHCFVADHLLRIGFTSNLQTPLNQADFVFVPFYSGWLNHYAKMNKTMVLETTMEKVRQILEESKKMGRRRIPLVVPATHDYGGYLGFAYDMRDAYGKASFDQHALLQDAIVLSPSGDYNTLDYFPHKDVVIPPATCNTPHLIRAFAQVTSVKRASERKYLLYFGGSTGRKTGSHVRSAILSGTLFPNAPINLATFPHARNGKYLEALNNSIFCPHVFGTTGWATRLSDAIYAGCIPVLTSDVTHPPFFDILDWSMFSVFVDWRQLEDIENVLLRYSPSELDEKQAWLLKVRDAFIYDPNELAQDVSGIRKGPLYYTLMSLKIRKMAIFPAPSDCGDTATDVLY